MAAPEQVPVTRKPLAATFPVPRPSALAGWFGADQLGDLRQQKAVGEDALRIRMPTRLIESSSVTFSAPRRPFRCSRNLRSSRRARIVRTALPRPSKSPPPQLVHAMRWRARKRTEERTSGAVGKTPSPPRCGRRRDARPVGRRARRSSRCHRSIRRSAARPPCRFRHQPPCAPGSVSNPLPELAAGSKVPLRLPCIR